MMVVIIIIIMLRFISIFHYFISQGIILFYIIFCCWRDYDVKDCVLLKYIYMYTKRELREKEMFTNTRVNYAVVCCLADLCGSKIDKRKKFPTPCESQPYIYVLYFYFAFFTYFFFYSFFCLLCISTHRNILSPSALGQRKYLHISMYCIKLGNI